MQNRHRIWTITGTDSKVQIQLTLLSLKFDLFDAAIEEINRSFDSRVIFVLAVVSSLRESRHG